MKTRLLIEVSKTHSDNSNEFNDIEDSDGEISILRIEEVNDIITRLIQAVLERKAVVGIPKLELFWSSVNPDIYSSDSNSETSKSDFEVGTAKDRMISIKKLGNIIKELETEIKSNKHNEVEKAHFYAMLSYFRLVECG
ncbi:19518_t:CDS:2 [Racocetra persica]|uniref:19518_t:CDS:1 n=1 Tax=Racocetra persica TaxID=160502 RepID=A0ACA9KIP4_9GLOM|nr:19518_t:CDS:2 [Racocetra persica]